jgi:hypothetical protein
MKMQISAIVLSIILGFTTLVQGQVKDEVKKDAKKVGNKTEEITSKTKAKIVDKEYADKVGPKGQTIYIDKHSKYYWIDSKGHKNYVAKALLKDK